MIEITWSISELLARYDLEPELFDIFVEGVFDRDVLSNACREIANRPTFYDISVVHVPDDLLGRHGLSNGNKQRAIALSREFGSLPESAKVATLVDRDLDHWLGSLEQSRRLRWTMFCCMENHFLTREIVSEILLTTARARIVKIETFFSSLEDVLRKLYAFRLADGELKWALQWVALKKYLGRKGDSITFAEDKYVIATLNRNAKLSSSQEFINSYRRWFTNLGPDVRLSARGHDYTDLLAWSVAAFGGLKEFSNVAAVERLFVLLSRSIETIQTEAR